MNKQSQISFSSPPPVAISGAGCLSAAGRNLEDNLASMLRGQRNLTPTPPFDVDHPCSYPVFAVPDTWLESTLKTSNSAADRCFILALTAAAEALATAGLTTPDSRTPMRIGICLGTVVGTSLEEESFYLQYFHGKCPEPEPATRFLAHPPARRLRTELGLDGPCMTVTTACTSGASAIAQAAAWITNGVCDAVLAGGTEKLSRVSLNGFVSLMIADRRSCRPFDQHRAGLNLGEGAGMLLLESAQSISRRNGEPIGWLLGAGNGCDAYHLSRPESGGSGLRRAISLAVKQAGIKPEEIAFINAHGTGTLDNDRVEGLVFQEIFPSIPFLSTKCYTGHTLGAAGAIEAALTLACLNQEIIPGTPEFSEADSETGAVPNLENRQLRASTALSTSLAYGGNNLALLLAGVEKNREIQDKLDSSPAGHIITWRNQPKSEALHSKSGAESANVPEEKQTSAGMFEKKRSSETPETILLRGVGTAGGFGCGAEALRQALKDTPAAKQTVNIRTPTGEVRRPAFLCDTKPLSDYVSKKELRRVDHFSRMTTLGIALALEDAGLYDYDRRRIGAILCTGLGSNQSTFSFIDSYLRHGDTGASPLLFSASGNSGALANASILLGLTGPSLTVCQPENGASVGLLTAIQWLRLRLADIVVVGAVEEYFPLRGYVLEKLGLLADHETIQPFDFTRDTAIVAEGAAFLALTRAEKLTTRPPIAELEADLRDPRNAPHEWPEMQPILIGADGNSCRSAPYAEMVKTQPGADWRSFTSFFGSMPASLPMHLAIAALTLDRRETLPMHPCTLPDNKKHITPQNTVPQAIHCLEAGKSGDNSLFSLALANSERLQ